MNKYLEWKMHIIHLIIVEYSKAPKYTTDEKKGLVATKNKNLSISLALNLRIMHLLILHHWNHLHLIIIIHIYFENVQSLNIVGIFFLSFFVNKKHFKFINSGV